MISPSTIYSWPVRDQRYQNLGERPGPGHILWVFSIKLLACSFSYKSSSSRMLESLPACENSTKHRPIGSHEPRNCCKTGDLSTEIAAHPGHLGMVRTGRQARARAVCAQGARSHCLQETHPVPTPPEKRDLAASVEGAITAVSSATRT